MAMLRVQMRLYDSSPTDKVVMEWLDALPKDERGRQRVKEHIVAVLAREIKRERRPPESLASRREKQDCSEVKDERTRAADPDPQPAPEVEERRDSLTEFPALESIRW